MRSFVAYDGSRWQVTLGKESWGTLVLLFTQVVGDGARTSTLSAETMFDASAELDALTDDELRARLTDSRPWS